ncbi:diaminobutyrate--2-oxoglutarate transaminase [Streptomyces corchorusii]|uniref:Diaminobutyrate--2-oxoglutarate transaminase n=2 Tax=Streptomyces TaxID=1883 RepID=A0A101PWI7_STRCK|nr:diaminobutyrate--2-oxoglutarate transaminase [Streptomyces corchorusii]AEY86674.1 aminotransferase [Streptomyces hygroscopicus subsp. jinggangensis 5008]AGF60898.1 aminotransferase [Streptomyces hygroscopicus subsp. jinggangensis TL01]KUN18663.1 diaminobutyrate--2-oxoglutarate transaminase [Streptomyces corchorusii]
MTEPDPTTVFTRHESRVRSYCRGFPAVFERASGHHLWDVEGRRYTDLLCGAGALNYGHNPPDMVARVVDHLAAGGPVQSLDLHTTAKAEFLTRLAESVLAPRGMDDYVVQFPGPAGTLAVEAALKLARKVTGRSRVIAFRDGFHGVSLGSLAATSSPLLRSAAGTTLHDVTILPRDDERDRQTSLDALERALRPAPGVQAPAAVMLETVQGEGGLNVASPAWLARVRELADEAGALVIVDDIQAGCGRTGTFFSFEHVPGLRPDLVCLSKSLGGMGLPMAALLISRDKDVWEPGEHNGTFRGHNLAFVAGTVALEYWADPRFTSQVARLTDAIRASLQDIVARLPEGVAHVAGRGAMSGLRFTGPEPVENVRRALFQAGIIAESAGEGRVLKFLPPLTMPVAEWEAVAHTIGDVVVKTVDTAVHRAA